MGLSRDEVHYQLERARGIHLSGQQLTRPAGPRRLVQPGSGRGLYLYPPLQGPTRPWNAQCVATPVGPSRPRHSRTMRHFAKFTVKRRCRLRVAIVYC